MTRHRLSRTIALVGAACLAGVLGARVARADAQVTTGEGTPVPGEPCVIYGTSTVVPCDGSSGGGSSSGHRGPSMAERHEAARLEASAKADRVESQADDARGRGDYQRAIDLYGDALQAYYTHTRDDYFKKLQEATREDWYRSKMALVDEAINAKRYDDVIGLINNALRVLDTKEGEAALKYWKDKLAAIKQADEDRKRAAERLQQEREHLANVADAATMAQRASTLLTQGQFEDAEALAKRGLHLDPHNEQLQALVESMRTLEHPAVVPDGPPEQLLPLAPPLSMASLLAPDPVVFDARGIVPIAPYLVDQVPALAHSPAVALIEGGYRAVVDHDWPLALKWWRDALAQDPNNAALKRSVDLADWMVRGWYDFVSDPGQIDADIQRPSTEGRAKVGAAVSMALENGAPDLGMEFLWASEETAENQEARDQIRIGMEMLDRRWGANPDYRRIRAAYEDVTAARARGEPVPRFAGFYAFYGYDLTQIRTVCADPAQAGNCARMPENPVMTDACHLESHGLVCTPEFKPEPIH